jgi:hypothetical protein
MRGTGHPSAMTAPEKLEHDRLCKAFSDEPTRDVLVHAMLEADGDFTEFVKGFRAALQEDNGNYGATAQRAASGTGH